MKVQVHQATFSFSYLGVKAIPKLWLRVLGKKNYHDISKN